MPKKQTKYAIDGKVLLKPSLQEFDGRKTHDPGEGDPSTGKWNAQKSRPAVVVSKWNIRKVG